MTLSNPAQYISGRTVQEQMNSLIDYVDQRAADVALDAIASDVAQVHQDMLDADADAAAAAASAAAAAGTLANAVKKTGESSQSIAGDIAVSGKVTSGATPSGNTDLTTKKYVDDQDALNVQLAGSQAISGAKTVPLETTGTFSDQIASSNKVKNELDNYAPMVRTSGDQNVSGVKVMTAYPVRNQPVQAQDNTGWHKIGSWQASSNTANQSAIFLIRYKQDTLALGYLIVNIRALTTNLEWLVKSSGVGTDNVIVARNTTSGVVDMYVYGYRLDIELAAPILRATSKILVGFTPEENPDTVYTEPAVGVDYDSVVKI